MENNLTVIGIQADLFWEDVLKNIAFFQKKIAKLSYADIIVLPEMFSTGFTMQPQKVAETMNGDTIKWIKGIANKYDLAICGSLVIKDKKQFYNRFIFVYPNGNINCYDKRHSFTLAGENNVYTSGKKQLLINYKGWKIFPLICYDLRFPVWARNTCDYDLLIYMANWPVTRIKAWDTLLKARAIENMSYTIGVNRVGKDNNNYSYCGNSLIVNYFGEELSSLPKDDIGIIEATLCKEKQNSVRKKLGFLKDRDSFTIDF